jgi:hypothetical protein
MSKPGDVISSFAAREAEPVETSSCRVRAAVGRVAGHILLHLALTDRRLVALVLVQALDHFLVSACCRLRHIALLGLLSPTGAGPAEGDDRRRDQPEMPDSPGYRVPHVFTPPGGSPPST